MNTCPSAVAIAAVTAACAGVQAQAPSQVVFAENFEAPLTSTSTVFKAGQSFRSATGTWQIEAASVDLFSMQTRRDVAAFDGNQAVDLAGSPGQGAMSARFATVPGRSYTLTFHYSRNSGLGATPAHARVEVLGLASLLRQEVMHDAARQSFDTYLLYERSFRADSPTALLRFTSLNPGNFGLVIDAISIAAFP